MDLEYRKYFVSFVEEAVLNPDYLGYIAGRIEVSEDWPESEHWPINELRFLTTKTLAFDQFRDQFDGVRLTRQELGRLAVEIQLRFQEFPRCEN